VVLLTSFFVEVFAVMPKLAGVMRFLAAAAFLGVEILFGRSTVPSVTVTRCLRVALLLLLLGVLFPVIWPMQRVAGLHIVFIGGFTLITFTVATRVVLGHSGKGHLVMQPLPFLRVAAGLLVIAAILRPSAISNGHCAGGSSKAPRIAGCSPQPCGAGGCCQMCGCRTRPRKTTHERGASSCSAFLDFCRDSDDRGIASPGRHSGEKGGSPRRLQAAGPGSL
jgi:hypothetical protein